MFFHLLVKGKLQVDYFQPEGKQAVFSFETPFSIIGDLELFEHRQVVGNVQTLEDSLLLTIPVGTIRNYGYEDANFLRFVIRHLAKKLYFSSILLSQAALSLECRLARYILYRMEKDGTIFQLEHREAIAAMLEVSIRHLNRTLLKFADLNAITIHNKTLKITDSGVLKMITNKGT